MKSFRIFLWKVLIIASCFDNIIHAQPGYFPICHVCPGGDHSMNDPNGILDTGLSKYKCSDARNYGLKRELGQASCLIFQMYANQQGGNGCDCKEPVSFPVENTNPVCNICPNLGSDGIIYPGTDDLYVKTTWLMEMPCDEIYFSAINQFFPTEDICQDFQKDVKDICCVEPSNSVLSGSGGGGSGGSGTNHQPGNTSSAGDTIVVKIRDIAALMSILIIIPIL